MPSYIVTANTVCSNVENREAPVLLLITAQCLLIIHPSYSLSKVNYITFTSYNVLHSLQVYLPTYLHVLTHFANTQKQTDWFIVI